MGKVEFKYDCGDEVRDELTGFEGVITAQTFNIIGCVQYAVEAKVTKDSSESKIYWLDEDRLEKIGESKAKARIQERSLSPVVPVARPGGPRREGR